jgi:hypothetical protein
MSKEKIKTIRKNLKQWAKDLGKQMGVPTEVAEWLLMAAIMDETQPKKPRELNEIVDEIIERMNNETV